MAACPVCRCAVVLASNYDPWTGLLANKIPPGSPMSGLRTLSDRETGFVCSGCGIRFLFQPPSWEDIIVKAVTES